jgi:hypothetical protein
MSRIQTRSYAARTLITRAIPLDIHIDMAELLDLADSATSDPESVGARADSVCQLATAVLELESALRLAREDAATSRAQRVVAQGLGQTRARQLRDERDAHQVTTLKLEAAGQDAGDLRGQLAQVQTERDNCSALSGLMQHATGS